MCALKVVGVSEEILKAVRDKYLAKYKGCKFIEVVESGECKSLIFTSTLTESQRMDIDYTTKQITCDSYVTPLALFHKHTFKRSMENAKRTVHTELKQELANVYNIGISPTHKGIFTWVNKTSEFILCKSWGIKNFDEGSLLLCKLVYKQLDPNVCSLILKHYSALGFEEKIYNYVWKYYDILSKADPLLVRTKLYKLANGLVEKPSVGEDLISWNYLDGAAKDYLRYCSPSIFKEIVAQGDYAVRDITTNYRSVRPSLMRIAFRCARVDFFLNLFKTVPTKLPTYEVKSILCHYNNASSNYQQTLRGSSGWEDFKSTIQSELGKSLNIFALSTPIEEEYLIGEDIKVVPIGDTVTLHNLSTLCGGVYWPSGNSVYFAYYYRGSLRGILAGTFMKVRGVIKFVNDIFYVKFSSSKLSQRILKSVKASILAKTAILRTKPGHPLQQLL